MRSSFTSSNYPSEGASFAMWAFVAIGLFGFNYPLLMAHSRSFLAPAYHGRGMAFLTALSFVGVALMQSVSGWMMGMAYEAQMSPSEQYRLLFILLGSALALAAIVYGFSARQGRGTGPLE